MDVLPRDGCRMGIDDVALGAEVALQALRQSSSDGKDDQVPVFMALHMSSNHVSNGWLMASLDRYVRRLLEYADLERTAIHIVGDHGSLVGNSLSNLYGQFEMRNPVSIVLPKWLRDAGHLSDTDWAHLHSNQQRLVSHHDSS